MQLERCLPCHQEIAGFNPNDTTRGWMSTKLSVISGWDSWHTSPALSDTETLANRGCLWVCVCRWGQIELTSECIALPVTHGAFGIWGMIEESLLSGIWPEKESCRSKSGKQSNTQDCRMSKACKEQRWMSYLNTLIKLILNRKQLCQCSGENESCKVCAGFGPG